MKLEWVSNSNLYESASQVNAHENFWSYSKISYINIILNNDIKQSN
jgi:hypothetical protein